MPSSGTTEYLCQRDVRLSIEPITMRVPDACRYLRIGRSTFYVLIASREIEVIKLGSATLVVTASLRSLVEQRRASRVLGSGEKTTYSGQPELGFKASRFPEKRGSQQSGLFRTQGER